DRELDALLLERLVPGQNMLIDAVDQRAVEIEQERCSADVVHLLSPLPYKRRAPRRRHVAGDDCRERRRRSKAAAPPKTRKLHIRRGVATSAQAPPSPEASAVKVGVTSTITTREPGE